MESVPVEALGSVTQLDGNSPSSGVLLRSSARVSKMKQDSLNKSIITSPVADKNDEITEEAERPPEKVPVRKLNWPQEDKDLFFEAVNEYGKDFQAIQKYFVAKSKKADSAEVKTVKRIRCFYYRTYAKIAPKLVFPEHIPKQAQELYGLINYGELRKKMKVRTKKDALRLNELIIKGFTQLRGKNKNINVRTPRCRTLRRLCQVEDSQESETRLPGSIRLELLPEDNLTWSRVQTLAQNPRVHIHVPLHYRLCNLLQYLQKRWLPPHEKYKAKVLEGLEGEAATIETGEMLLLKPKQTATVHVSQVNINHCNSHTKICLSSYEERLGKKGASLEVLSKLYAEFGTRAKKQKMLEREEKEARKAEGELKEARKAEEELKEAKKAVEELKKAKKVEEELKEDMKTKDETMGAAIAPTDHDVFTMETVIKSEHMSVDVKEEPLNSPVPGTSKLGSEAMGGEEDGKRQTDAASSEGAKNSEDRTKDAGREDVLARLQTGWTLENCHTATVGDIYLMMGSDYKLQLNYSWKPVEEPSPKVASMAHLTSMLKRLIRLSRLIRPHCPVQCQCGHECSESKRTRKDSFGEEGGGGLQSSDPAFRRPPTVQVKRVLPPTGRLDADSFRAQMDKLTPRYCNRRGRGIGPKSVLLQRTLPKALLPKATSEHPIVSVKLLQQPSQIQGEIVPVELTPTRILHSGPRRIAPKEPEPPDPPPSPTPSITSLINDTIKDFPLPANFAGGLDDCPPPSPSPSVVLREGWLNDEVTDYSLSSILSHLDAPLKSAPSEPFDSAPPDVETHLQYLMSETSIDYMAKFADLAAKVSSEASQ